MSIVRKNLLIASLWSLAMLCAFLPTAHALSSRAPLRSVGFSIRVTRHRKLVWAAGGSTVTGVPWSGAVIHSPASKLPPISSMSLRVNPSAGKGMAFHLQFSGMMRPHHTIIFLHAKQTVVRMIGAYRVRVTRD